MGPTAYERPALQLANLYGGNIPGYSSTNRSPYSKAEIFSLFAENNMELTDSTMLTPGLRFDHHSIVGITEPVLNLSQGLGMTLP